MNPAPVQRPMASCWLPGTVSRHAFGHSRTANNAVCLRCANVAVSHWRAAPEAAVEFGPSSHARQHVVAGTQRNNMIRMAYTGRGGVRPVVRRNGLPARRERSVALREAVRHAWDTDARAAGSGDRECDRTATAPT